MQVSIPLTYNPSFVNPQEATLNIQAAMKNLHTNAVFYFLIPNTFDNIIVPLAAMDINSLVAVWKSINDSLEVSALANG